MRKVLATGRALQKFFEGLVQHAFLQELGVGDTRLADYLSDLLCRFARMDMVFGLRDVQGRRLEEVAEMLTATDGRALPRDREREIHKHIGDFVLFWTGVYPEFLRSLRGPQRKDHLIDYMAQGRRSYKIASGFDYEPYRREAQTLRKLSKELELCTYGLGLVRKGWESLSPATYRGFRKKW